jgi:hypothetical protein
METRTRRVTATAGMGIEATIVPGSNVLDGINVARTGTAAMIKNEPGPNE